MLFPDPNEQYLLCAPKDGIYPHPKVTSSKSSNHFKSRNNLMIHFPLGSTIVMISLKMCFCTSYLSRILGSTGTGSALPQ